jgi:hypothetical protein
MRLGYVLLLICIAAVDPGTAAASLSSGCQVQAKADPGAGIYSTADRLRQLVFTKRKKGPEPFASAGWLPDDPLIELL